MEPATRDDIRIARSENDVALVHPDGQTSRQNKEELVSLWMAVPSELALNLCHSHVVVVDDRDRSRRPVLGYTCQQIENVARIEFAMSLPLHMAAAPAPSRDVVLPNVPYRAQ